MFFVEAVMRRFLKANFKKSIVLSYDRKKVFVPWDEDLLIFPRRFPRRKATAAGVFLPPLENPPPL